MWLDADTNLDYLNFGETAELVVSLLTDAALLPVSLGIFGGWGSGKSTLLRLVERRLEEIDEDERPIVVNFDAWLFQDFDDARASLIDAITARLEAEAKKNETLLTKVVRLGRHVNLFRLVSAGAQLGVAAAGGGAVSAGWNALRNIVGGSGTADDQASVDAAAERLQSASAGVIGDGAGRSPVRDIQQFRREFQDVMREFGRPLIVVIDNLDRCLPSNAIQTLEAIRLFLFMPDTAFIVAADDDMVRHSVREHFRDGVEERHVTDYLDKLIQVPIRVPRLGEQEIRAYMFLLFAENRRVAPPELEKVRRFTEDRLRESWKAEPFSKEDFVGQLSRVPDGLSGDLELAERLAPLLANTPKIDGNPRTVKRLLNSVKMRARIASQRKMNLDDSLLAKLAVFERCTDQASAAALFRSITEAPDGRSAHLRTIESETFDPRDMSRLPEAWKNHAAFISGWVNIEPRLADADLRGAVYLTRETAVLQVTRAGLSSEATQVFKLLARLPNSISPSAQKQAKVLTGEDAAVVMSLLVAEMRKVTDWSAKPLPCNGAILLSHAFPNTRDALRTYLESLPNRPKWLMPVLRELEPKKDN